jgi:hypothetical protein
MWTLNDEDNLQWLALRDSITSAVQRAAGGRDPCLSEQLYGNGGRATVWLTPGYRFMVVRFERVPRGPRGYQLQIGLFRGDSSCSTVGKPPA